MLSIRPFDYSDADYAAAVAISNTIWPEYPGTVEEWRHGDETRDPKYIHERFLALVGDRVVGVGNFGEMQWSHKPGKLFIGVNIDPDQRRRGYGGAFYDFLRERVAAHEPTLLASETREDQADAIRFLERRGFTQVMRSPISELDVQAFDPVPFAAYSERVAARGIRIASLAELMKEAPDTWKRKYYDVLWEGFRDVPSPDPVTRSSYETYEKRLKDPNFMPEGTFIAIDGDAWVGLSQLWKGGAREDLFYTGLTGVARSHRRLGLAMALKLRALAFAREAGVATIETDNEENNPMYQINLRLGFEPRPAWLSYHNPLRTPTDESEGADTAVGVGS